jgi:hypothetical protein
MSTLTFLLLLALGLRFAPGMAQTIPANCQTGFNALQDCRNLTYKFPSDECLGCQGQALASLPIDQPCNSDLIVGAYQKCLTECYLSDYECSQLDIQDSACRITEIRCPKKGESSGSNAYGGDKAMGTSGVIEASWATAFPIMATLLLGGVML